MTLSPVRFRSIRRIWHDGSGKLWFVPAQMDTQAMLTVEARRLDSAHAKRVYKSSRIGRPAGSRDRRSLSLGPPFYPTDIRLPSPGVWLLVAHAGTNWGCFVFEFH